MRRVALFIAVAFFAATSARAESDEAREAFVETYRCAVVELLTATQTQERDRFLILSTRDGAPNYVQCLFSPDRRQILCEAASGFYEHKADEPRTAFLSAADKAKLARLGFSLDDSQGNFQRMMDVRAVGAFGEVADVMLGALYDVYGARLKTPIETSSPFLPAHGTLRRMSCPPVS